MHIEYEIKFTQIHFEKTIEAIQSLGGIQTKKRTLMRRAVFLHPTDPQAYLRVRDEGDRITTTYKRIAEGTVDIHSVSEIECQVSDFSHMREIYKALGIQEKAYQETYREVWNIHDEVECMIDEWPGIGPIIEIEGGNEYIVKKYSELLGFDYAEGLFGAIDQVYEAELGIPKDILNNHTPIITFEYPPKKTNTPHNSSF
ncbi:CYTH domain-containing protein [Candidatus Gracilibacteria bacterium]|nr:CYTH domain-containing protein [Candidatus Gracilibacteria bacterium]